MSFLRYLCCVSVSLDCPFLIAPSVFSNVYLSGQSPNSHVTQSVSYCFIVVLCEVTL
jgi:hypothetical protein